jgi:lipase
MMSRMSPIDSLRAPVSGGELTAYRFGEPAALSGVLAVHGITGTSHAWLAVARELDGQAALIAPDLRGRGASNQLPAPYGIAAHVADLVALLDHLEIEQLPLLVGHSLGAYICARLAADHPERVRSLLLIDGGLSLPGLENVDAQRFLDAFLGPAIARLRMTFESREAYRDWWRVHPAFKSSDVLDSDLTAYADYDLVGDAPALHSSVNETAIRGDAGDMFEMGEPAHRLEVQALLMCAPRGLLDEPNPMQPLPLGEAWVAESPARRRVVQVPDVNHYTIVMGAAGAGAVSDAVRAALRG